MTPPASDSPCGPRVINPRVVDGQVHGGVAQDIGQALLEHCVYAPDSAQLLSGSAMDYAIPRDRELPFFRTERIESPAPGNPLGVKGMGEAGALPAPPALVGAVEDALASIGCDVPDMPLTPHRIWQQLQAARKTK